jgi:bifunctional non-homologous end joining protein LigD
VGERSHDWVKLKVAAAQEFAILGYTPISNGQAQIGALLVGVREGQGYRYAGKVGTGFDTKTRERLYRELGRDETASPPVLDRPRMKDAHWVKPRLVAQVAFTEWTRDGKLRHPRFQGLRDDKSPEQVVRERPSRH